MRLAACLLTASLPLALAASALADASSEIDNAANHAALAAQARSIDSAHTHMHHALNCLVGPAGDGFDATQMNPCQSGGGAIPDETDQTKRAKLLIARGDLYKGIAENSLAAAKADASAAQAVIESAR